LKPQQRDLTHVLRRSVELAAQSGHDSGKSPLLVSLNLLGFNLN